MSHLTGVPPRLNIRLGYGCAALAAAVSGISVYVNSLGVQRFSDPVLYTALKDGVVGLALLMPLLFSTTRRAEYGRLDRPTCTWLVLLALTGGSVPFALFFTGLKLTTPATGAVINHVQFILVALFAAIFLREPIRPGMWAGFAVLLLGTLLGTNLHALAWNQGAALVGVSTVLFAVDFVIAKHLLRGLRTLTVMTARMTLGTGILFIYVLGTGRIGQVGQLEPAQWRFVLITGVLLLAFTVSTFTAIRHAPVSAVLAIGTAAPIITTLLQIGAAGRPNLGPADAAGLVVILVAVAAIILAAVRQASKVPMGYLQA